MIFHFFIKLGIAVNLQPQKFPLIFTFHSFLCSMIFCFLFSVKWLFCFNIVASLLQRWSAPLMFKIAILLSLIDIINTSWHLLQTFRRKSKPISKNTNSENYCNLLTHFSWWTSSDALNIDSFRNVNFIII